MRVRCWQLQSTTNYLTLQTSQAVAPWAPSIQAADWTSESKDNELLQTNRTRYRNTSFLCFSQSEMSLGNGNEPGIQTNTQHVQPPRSVVAQTSSTSETILHCDLIAKVIVWCVQYSTSSRDKPEAFWNKVEWWNMKLNSYNHKMNVWRNHIKDPFQTVNQEPGSITVCFGLVQQPVVEREGGKGSTKF